MTIKWRHCAIAERDHREDVRNYAHTYHYPQTICLAKDFWKLPRQYRDGIILHEIGHLLAGPDGSESDANDAVFDWAGAQIEYVDSPYGRRLERLSNMAGARIARRRRRNPIANEDHLPYDQWIPSHAVKFNSDGTVDLMTEGEHNPRRNARVEDLRDGRVYVYMTNFGYYAGDSFSTLQEAIEWAKSRGFESQFVRDGEQLGSWTPFGGVRLKHQYEHEYFHNAGMVQNIQGYKDKYGFHPIRWDSDYDTSELTDPEPRDYTISPSRKFYSMSGETPPRSRKRRRR